MKIRTLALIAVCSAALPAVAVEPAFRDLVFAKVDGQELKLDLYLPESETKAPLVVYIHGGGWRKGSYKSCRTAWLAEHGFAVASISYRLTDKAIFPAQIHDCKGAVRWLRAHADKYGYDAKRIGVVGTSAGGHLSLMLGVTAGDTAMEGSVGGNPEQSSRAAAIVDYYGPSDFVLRAGNQPSKTQTPDSPVFLLLGGPAGSLRKEARFASPAYHVTSDDPPLLILHGDKDATVKLDQSERMLAAYEKFGLPVKLEVVPGAGHGSAPIFAKKYQEQVAEFFRLHLVPGD